MTRVEKKGLQGMELLHYVRLVRRRWTLVTASILLALFVAAGLTATSPPSYASSITLIVSAPSGGGGSAAFQATLLAKERVKSYARLIGGRGVADRVARTLGDGTNAEDLRRRITAQALTDTVLLRATVTDRSPGRAMLTARTLGTEFARYIDGLERATPSDRPVASVRVAEDADLPTVPTSPRPLLNLALGLTAGAIAGIVAALLREFTDTSVRNAHELREATGRPTLGVIGLDRRLGERPLITRATGNSPRGETFRSLAATLRFAGTGDAPRSVVITSTVPGEGRTTVACDLAVALAEGGRRVILVDADLRDPHLADGLGAENAPGLSDLLKGDRLIDDVLRRRGPESLLLLPSGPAERHPGELLGSPRMAAVVSDLVERADVVVFDTPPLQVCADAAVLARLCSGAVLVTRYGSTPREEVAEAIERLQSFGIRVLGTVLNAAGRTDRFARQANPSNLPEPALADR